MKRRRVVFRDEALADLDEAAEFYEAMEPGLGNYCFDSILSDVEALEFFGGIHPVQFGAHCLRAKRFPFNIYYDVDDGVVTVLAILDMRQDPDQSLLSLQSR